MKAMRSSLIPKIFSKKEKKPTGKKCQFCGSKERVYNELLTDPNDWLIVHKADCTALSKHGGQRNG